MKQINVDLYQISSTPTGRQASRWVEIDMTAAAKYFLNPFQQFRSPLCKITLNEAWKDETSASAKKVEDTVMLDKKGVPWTTLTRDLEKIILLMSHSIFDVYQCSMTTIQPRVKLINHDLPISADTILFITLPPIPDQATARQLRYDWTKAMVVWDVDQALNIGSELLIMFEDHLRDIVRISEHNLTYTQSNESIGMTPALQAVVGEYDADFLERFIENLKKVFMWPGELLYRVESFKRSYPEMTGVHPGQAEESEH